MFPPELVENICKHLDLPSVCALAQTNRFWRESIRDPIFEQHLLPLCPWFELSLSHRPTWRDCAFEFQRRQKTKPVITARTPDHISAVEFATSVDIDIKYERLDSRKLLHNPVYTSKHGIQVDLTSSYVNSILREAPHREDHALFELKDDYDSKIISLPHVVVILYYKPLPDYYLSCDIVVKSRFSQGLQPDSVQSLQTRRPMAHFCVAGRHVFLTITKTDMTWDIMYLINNRFVPLYNAYDDEYPQSLTCYDGLLHYFDSTHYCIVHIDVKNDDQVAFGNRRHGLEIDPYFRSDFREAVDTYSPFLLVVDCEQDPYIFHIEKGVVALAREKKNGVYSVEDLSGRFQFRSSSPPSPCSSCTTTD
ncbi:hypothetical protein CJU90_2931 [Yarrowia sp. C11]|nr:hypothetical protein CKK34_4381 [Yarrowia sp. E02]KAG5369473.1 hypothetical protein CJU90_2931 [Yarrowia sp. C11]